MEILVNSTFNTLRKVGYEGTTYDRVRQQCYQFARGRERSFPAQIPRFVHISRGSHRRCHCHAAAPEPLRSAHEDPGQEPARRHRDYS